MMVSKYKEYAFGKLKEIYLEYIEKEQAILLNLLENGNENLEHKDLKSIKKNFCSVAYECMKAGIPFQIDEDFVWIQYKTQSIPVLLKDLQESQQKYENIISNATEKIETVPTDLDIKESINTLRFIMQNQDNVIKGMINAGREDINSGVAKGDIKELKVEINKLQSEKESLEVENKDLNQQLAFLTKEYEDEQQKLKECHKKEKDDLERNFGLQLSNLIQEHDDEVQKLKIELEKQIKKNQTDAPDSEYFEQIREELKKSESEKLLLEKTNNEMLSQLQELKKKYQEAKMYAFEDKKFNCNNANAFNRFFGEQDVKMSVAYVMLDSLHELNMRAGRNAGDKGIMALRNALIETYGHQHVYRIMGGQFFVFTENDEELNMLDRIKSSIKGHNLEMSYGIVREGEFEDKNTIVNECMERCVNNSKESQKGSGVKQHIWNRERQKEKTKTAEKGGSTIFQKQSKNPVQGQERLAVQADEGAIKEITESYFVQEKEVEENLRKYMGTSSNDDDDFDYEEIQSY